MFEQLKPCPACGDKAGVSPVEDDRNPCVYYAVECLCGMRGPEKSAKASAITAWNSLPRELRWTTEPPAQTGWYFFREAWDSGDWRNYGPVYVYLDQDTNALQIRGWGRTKDGVINYGHHAQTRKPEWAGPIALPPESQGEN